MKKRIILLITSAVLILCIGVAVAAELQSKEESVPKDAAGQITGSTEITDGVVQPIAGTLLPEGENGRLVLADVDFPEIPLETVDLAAVRELLDLALVIYEKNDIVVLEDREIVTNQKCAQGVLTEITYEAYGQYMCDIYSIFKEIAKQIFPTEIHVDTDEVYDPCYSNLRRDGDSFLFDFEPGQCGWENATEWFRDWWLDETETCLFSQSRRLFFMDSFSMVWYVDSFGNDTVIFPVDEIGETFSYLSSLELEREFNEIEESLGVSVEELMQKETMQ